MTTYPTKWEFEIELDVDPGVARTTTMPSGYNDDYKHELVFVGHEDADGKIYAMSYRFYYMDLG